MALTTIYFTVTNDLTYDQRMNRICTSLADHGYNVVLVGRRRKQSQPLRKEKYQQKRLRCWFQKGKLFYAEYNFRLFFYLLFRRLHGICAIDLDTIIPCYWISRIKKVPRIYDAHELFTELKEVVSRPMIQKTWRRIERRYVPKFSKGYTVSDSIAGEFERRYGVHYETIRNVSRLREFRELEKPERFILYSGAVNEARAFEYLIPAMKMVRAGLVVCGDGNFMPQLKALIAQNGVEDKVELRGMLLPDELWEVSLQAWAGVGVAENEGLNQYLALPNKFFDYIHAGLPQLSMDYPEYRRINARFEVATLIEKLDPEIIASALNNLLENAVMYRKLKDNCMQARVKLNWQEEEKKLLSFYQSVFSR